MIIKKLRGLFLNTIKENCSIHESGIMVFNILQQPAEEYMLDYLEINQANNVIPLNYDFYVFNYHYAKMGWLDTSKVSELPGKKYAIVLEVSPGNPFACINENDFDGYMVLDPTIALNNPKVFPYVRPLELEAAVNEYKEHDIPVIGSFGYPTPGKGFDLLVDAVNKEFDRAIVRINVSPVNEDTYKHCYALYNTNYTDYLENLCKSVAKPNIEVQYTREYFSKEELINWCASNTLNCFMYNRFQTGLSATTDQAIVSGRPLAISSNETFRHIHQFITPYPYRSLKESIIHSSDEVTKIKKQWTNTAFENTFIKMLEKTGVENLPENAKKYSLKSKIDNKLEISLSQRIIGKIKRTAKKVLKTSSLVNVNKNGKEITKNEFLLEIPQKESFMKDSVLIVSHSSRKCGIHEFGWNLKEALKNSKKYHFCYTECGNAEELLYAIEQTNPGVIIYNHYPATMPWLTEEIKETCFVPQVGYLHEFDQTNIKQKVKEGFFDFYICPDPSLNVNGIDKCFTTGRLLSKYQNYYNLPSIPTIGSFGFGFPDKGFERLVTTVQNEFDEAIININMPFNDIVDPDGTLFTTQTAQRCRNLLKKPGIKLNITHDYLSKKQILDFLAANTINVFLYNSDKTQGISSVLDYAISAQRPIAISSAKMFRHVGSLMETITIENNSLRSIIDRGIAPLIPLLNDWSEPRMIMCFERLVERTLKKEKLVLQ